MRSTVLDIRICCPRLAIPCSYGKRGAGDPPAVVDLTDDVPHRDAHVVVVHFAEVCLADQGSDRPDLDPGLVHVAHEPGDAAVLGHVRVGPDEHLLVIGDLGVARPELHAVHHEVVAVALGRGPEGREVGAGIGLREALAPDGFAAQDRREPPGLLLIGAAGDERGPRVAHAHEQRVHMGDPGPRGLLVPDHLPGQGEPTPAVLTRPADPGVAGLVQRSLPRKVSRAERRADGARRRRRGVLGEPRAQAPRGRRRRRVSRRAPSGRFVVSSRATS